MVATHRSAHTGRSVDSTTVPVRDGAAALATVSERAPGHVVEAGQIVIVGYGSVLRGLIRAVVLLATGDGAAYRT